MDPVKILPIEQMDGEFREFIGVWENFLPKEFCSKIISRIEQLIADSLLHIVTKTEDTEEKTSITPIEGTGQFPNSNMGRKDISIFLNGVAGDLTKSINEFLYSCLNHYREEYGQLKTVNLMSWDIKAQRTKPGGGYHAWHYENSSYDMAPRELVWAIYLNDMPENEAETEFLYQKRRIKPTVGTVVIWPAGMTHVHRGNPVYTGTKYILTGWFLKGPE
jgi:hypothetical protein